MQYRSTDDLAQKARASLEIYTNPAFGWHIASTYARNRELLPITMTKNRRDRWLFIAYMALLNPALHADRHVEEAHQIYQNPGKSAKLKALLIAGLGQPVDDHLKLVAEKTGFHRRTVEAFETLFFNVLDRHTDGLYLSEIVYPETRVVEVFEDYFQTASPEDLLIRAAYNHRDVDLVLRLAGMTEAALRKELHEMSEAELESRIMGNALLIAKLGLLNQRSAGMERAIALLVARRHQPDKVSEEDMRELNDLAARVAAELEAAIAAMQSITEEERQALQATARPGKSYWHDEEGNIMETDYPDFATDASQHAETPHAPFVEFPEPVSGIWKNKHFDKPVVIVARMSEPGLPDYYLTKEGSGIPVSEVFFN